MDYSSNYRFDPETSLNEMIETLPTIVLEDLLKVTKGTSLDELNVEAHVVVPTFMLIEVYRWVKNLGKDMYSWKYVCAGGVDHLSLDKFIRDVESLIEKKGQVKDFCNMILSHYLVRQHHRVALEKLMGYNLETFRILENEGKLEYRNGYQPNFNQFRGHQALTALRDLGILQKIDSSYQVTSLGQKVIKDVRQLARTVKTREWGEMDAVSGAD